MADKQDSLSKEEINVVLNSVRTDNAENESKFKVEHDVSLSQNDLDKLLSGMPATGNKENVAGDDKAAKRAAKIAERKARAAAILAKSNAESPKDITVVYGSTRLSGSEASALQAGAVIELERTPGDFATILLDGKPFAKGILGKQNKKTAIQITELL